MRYYTKEWELLSRKLDSAEMFESVPDKEYSDVEIEELYQYAMENYVDELRMDYETPPSLEEIDPEGWEPEDLEEMRAALLAEYDMEIAEFLDREPFNEEEEREEFAEMYRDNLEEPDEDLPLWLRKEVDPRLIAMYLLPESAYLRLCREDSENQRRFDELDELADDALEDMYAVMPVDYEELIEDFDQLDGDDIISFGKDGDDLVIELAGWDEEGDEVIRRIVFGSCEIIEMEAFEIHAGRDEDGDIESDLSLCAHEVYFEDENGRIEVHMLLDNEENGLKYLTLLCDSFWLEEERLY